MLTGSILVVWLKNTLYVCVDEFFFCQRCSVFKGCFTWTRHPIFNPNLFVRNRYSLLVNLFIHAQVGNKNVHNVIHSKLQAEGGQILDWDKMAKLLVQGTSVLSITNENV